MFLVQVVENFLNLQSKQSHNFFYIIGCEIFEFARDFFEAKISRFYWKSSEISIYLKKIKLNKKQIQQKSPRQVQIIDPSISHQKSPQVPISVDKQEKHFATFTRKSQGKLESWDFSDFLSFRLFEWTEVWVDFEEAGRDRFSVRVVGSNPPI
jgi:hypothetical protein